MRLFHLRYRLKLLCLLAISFFIEFILIYTFSPVDVYHQTSIVSQIAINSIEFLNTKIPLFPSHLVFIIKQQRMIGAMITPQQAARNYWLRPASLREIKLPAIRDQIQKFLVNQKPTEAVFADEKLTYITQEKLLHIDLTLSY